MPRRIVPRLTVDEFWASTTPEPNTGCLLSTRIHERDRYGTARVEGVKEKAAHRIAYTLAHGRIPKGMYVMHLCNVKGCVEPTHLRIGTPQENSAASLRDGLVDLKARGQKIGRSLRDLWAQPSYRAFLAHRRAARSARTTP